MNHEPIPQREKVIDEKGIISRIWFQFLYAIFGNFEKRIKSLEDRVTALEP